MPDKHKEFLQKLLSTFRSEAEEHLQAIVSGTVALEQAHVGAQAALLEGILRRLHTFKGAARAVNLTDLEALCHAMESLLSAALGRGSALAPGQFDLLHQAASLARALVAEPSGRTRNQALALVTQLDALARQIGTAAAEPDMPAPMAPMTAIEETSADAAAVPEMLTTDVVRVQGRHLDAIRYHAESLLAVDLGLQHQIGDLLQLADEMEAQAAMLEWQAQATLRGTGKRTPPAEQGSQRFALQCRQLANALGGTRRQFATIRSRLMEATLETALVPFASVLEPLPGLIRNLARSSGKRVALEVQGEDLQIDRRVLDIVREALIHLVTNAVDHGIEPEDRRAAAGKPAAGSVRIRVAPHSGDRIALTVADDGAGIDVARIIDTALARGKLSEDEVAGLSDDQKLQLIAHARVSTSAQPSQVSGRGMGLAIVADKLATVDGALRIENHSGAGCAFELLLPVRLATMKALVVRAQGNRFVLPASGIESVRALGGDDIRTVENRETLLAGRRVLPVIRLDRLLRLQSAAGSETSKPRIALVAHADRHRFALLVDEILAEQEVLPKSLGRQLRRVRYVTGATQLGDGSLIPILGLEDIARYGLAAGSPAADEMRQAADTPARKRLLVAEDSITSRLLLKHILESAGYLVETAVDGLDALSRLRQAQFDALISDIEMPHMDGLALTERIRADPATEDMPVILVTSLQSPQERERGLHAGADAYVVKGSFDQDNLLATLNRLI